MIVQVINTTSNTLTYPNENLSITSGTTIDVTFILNSFAQDPNVLSDIANGNLNLTDTIQTYSGQTALLFLNNALNTLHPPVVNTLEVSGNLLITTELLTQILLELKSMRMALIALACDGNEYKPDDFDPEKSSTN